MIAEQPVHPRKEQLIAFGQGKLAAPESLQVEEHLEACPDCCETLLELKDDTFTGLVRTARLSPADAETVASVAESSGAAPAAMARSEHAATLLEPLAKSRSASELPAELRDHPRYRIVEQIGHGGMGSVYRAEHRLMNRPVAIKVINSQLVQHPHAVDRFRREVQAAAKLSHPNIVAAYDAEQAGNLHYLVMEFVDGTDLATYVNGHGPLSVAAACDCIRQAAIGLQHAHEKGMVHRDIKPHNLMLTPEGRVRILDFGLAGFATETALLTDESRSESAVAPRTELPVAGHEETALHLTAMGSVMGTPDYMAPEQATDAHTADIRADIYSLGCTLHFLLTGRPPFESQNVVEKLQAHASQSPPDLGTLRDDVSPGLTTVISRLMAKQPSDRFQTPAEVAAANGASAAPPSSPRKPRLRTRAAALAGAAILLAGVIVILGDKGRFEIRSERDDVEFAILQNGQLFKTIDLQTGSQITWLPSGDYEIALKQGNSFTNLDQKGFRLARWGKEIVHVTREPAVPVEAPSDRDRLQGEWIAESGQRGGQPVPLEQIEMQRAVFHGNQLHVDMPDGRTGDGSFQLIENTTPKQIVIQVEGENVSMRGIYMVDGDRLTLCMNQERARFVPDEFASKPGTMVDLIMMRRVASIADQPAFDVTPFEAELARQNRSVTGNSLPAIIFERGGHAAFRFGKWLLVFEGVPCQGNPKAAGLLGIGGFNYPIGGGRGTVGKTTFGDQVSWSAEWDSQANVITVADKYVFKLRGRATKLEFDDKTYDATNSVQTILVARDGSTRLTESKKPTNFAHSALTLYRTIQQDTQPVQWIEAAADGKHLFTAGDGEIVVRDAASLATVRTLVTERLRTRTVAASPIETLIATGGHDGWLELWNWQTAQRLAQVDLGKGWIEYMEWLPDGKSLVVKCEKSPGYIVWNVADRRIERTMDQSGQAIVISPDGKWLAAGERLDGTVRIFEIATGTVRTRLPHHAQRDRVRALAFSGDGRRLLTGADDRKVKLWDVASGNLLHTFDHPGGIHAAEFLHDGKHIVTGCKDERTLTIWNIESEQVTASVTDVVIGEKGLVLLRDGQHLATTEPVFQLPREHGKGTLQLWLLREHADLPVAKSERANLAAQRNAGLLTNPPKLPPEGVPVGRNLIADPSLEATPTGNLPNGWFAWLNDGPNFKCEVVEGGVTGMHCLQISGSDTRGVVFATSIPLDRTKRYALKGRVKVEGEAGTWAVIKLNYFNNTGWLGVDDRAGVTTGDFDWKLLEKTDQADDFPAATLLVPTCHIEGNGTAWFDELEVIAYERDKLPENFDATHGRNNRMKGN
jgi:uncharacterized protein (TIGR03067 family)